MKKKAKKKTSDTNATTTVASAIRDTSAHEKTLAEMKQRQQKETAALLKKQ